MHNVETREQIVYNGVVTITSLLASLIAASTAGAIVYAEFLTAPPPPTKVVHVQYWEKWTKFERDAMGVVVDQYNRTQGKAKNIYVDYLPVSGIEDKTLIAASGGNPPDISGLASTDIASFADDQALNNLDDLCKQYGIKESDYVPIYWQEVFYRNHVYALPTTPACMALHYNKAEFRAAGLDPDKPPQTIDELNADADKLTIKGDNGGYKQMGFAPSEPGWWNYGWGFFFGGSLWDGKDKITCNSPENVRAFEWVASWSKKYGTTGQTSFKNSVFSSPSNPFMESKLAMEIQGVWMANFIQTYGPKGFEWAAAPFPYPSDRPDLKHTTIVDLDNLVIPVGAKHVKEAFDFMAYVQQQKNMELLCLGQKKNSPLANVSEDFLKKSPNPFIRMFNDLPKEKNVKRPPMMSIWKQYQDEMNNAFDEVNLLQKTPEQALDDVHDRMQPVLDQYNRVMAIREAAQK
ncbi:MAG TPA: ABC transporter substrate-binding protein [Fimbriimonadaceae bacterium]|jgi:multiple sugar transport system substrate-binding protein